MLKGQVPPSPISNLSPTDTFVKIQHFIHRNTKILKLDTQNKSLNLLLDSTDIKLLCQILYVSRYTQHVLSLLLRVDEQFRVWHWCGEQPRFE